MNIPPSLIARRDEFARREQGRAADMDRFFEEARTRFGGQDVFLFAVWPILFEWAEAGLARGIRNAFGPGSLLMSGGGNKGRVLPDNYREQINEFLGFDNCFEFYSMSELMAGWGQRPRWRTTTLSEFLATEATMAPAIRLMPPHSR